VHALVDDPLRTTAFSVVFAMMLAILLRTSEQSSQALIERVLLWEHPICPALHAGSGAVQRQWNAAGAKCMRYYLM
jgi:hypothetical protein